MKKPFKKHILPALALGAVMFTAISCGGSASAYKPFEGNETELTATVTWWNNYKQPKDQAEFESNKKKFKEYEFQTAVIAEFNKTYPNIKVQPVEKGSYNDIYEAVKSGLTTGTVPNIATCYPDHVAAYQEAGATLVMDDFIADPTIGLKDASDLNQTYWNGEKNMYGEKKFLSLPYSKSGETLAVNQTVFDHVGAGKAGTDTVRNGKPQYTAPVAAATKQAYKVPTTYKELISTARQMKVDFPEVFANQRDADGFFTAVPFCYDSAENMFISFCEMAGIPYTDATGATLDKQVLFNNPEAKEMLVNIKKWNNEGLFATQDQLPFTNKAKGYHAYSSDMVVSGKIFMCITSTAGARYFALDDGFKTTLNETPTFDKNSYDGATGTTDVNKHKVISQGPSLTFFKKENNDENYASWLFYRFLTNTQNSAKLATMTSYFPLRTSSYEEESIKKLITAAETPVKKEDSYNTKTNAYNGTALKLSQTYTQKQDWFSSDVFKYSSSTRVAIGDLVETVLNDKDAKTDEEIKALVEKSFKAAYKTAIGA